MGESFVHCYERQSPRPHDATHRVILSLYVELEPDEPTGAGVALIVPLNREGMPAGPYKGGNGRPREPQRRTIDLRAGDQILCEGRWRTIKGIAAYRSHWMNETQAAARRDDEGYVYRAS